MHTWNFTQCTWTQKMSKTRSCPSISLSSRCEVRPKYKNKNILNWDIQIKVYWEYSQTSVLRHLPSQFGCWPCCSQRKSQLTNKTSVLDLTTISCWYSISNRKKDCFQTNHFQTVFQNKVSSRTKVPLYREGTELWRKASSRRWNLSVYLEYDSGYQSKRNNKLVQLQQPEWWRTKKSENI